MPIKSYEAEKIFLILENRGKHPPPKKKSYNLNKNHTIRFSVSENLIVEVSSSYLQKCGILHFLPEDRSRMRVYLFVFLFCFFPRGDRID